MTQQDLKPPPKQVVLPGAAELEGWAQDGERRQLEAAQQDRDRINDCETELFVQYVTDLVLAIQHSLRLNPRQCSLRVAAPTEANVQARVLSFINSQDGYLAVPDHSLVSNCGRQSDVREESMTFVVSWNMGPDLRVALLRRAAAATTPELSNLLNGIAVTLSTRQMAPASPPRVLPLPVSAPRNTVVERPTP